MSKFTQFFLAVILTFTVSACGTVIPGVSDIDKSQLSVTLAAVTNMFQPFVDWESGKKKALRQCAEFGYPSARPLEFSSQQCRQADQFGNCTSKQIEQKFICTK